MLLFLLWACAGDDAVSPSPSTTGDTGLGPQACEPTDNPLRFDCALDGEGTIAWWPQDDPADVREASGTDAVRIWGLRPDVPTVVRFPDGRERRQAPGELPAALQGATVQVEGAGLGTWVVTTSPCSNKLVVVFDGAGRVRWFQEHDKRVLGLDVTPTGHVLTMLGGGDLVEYDPIGEVVWTTTNPTAFPIHHDLARDDKGFTYVLSASVYNEPAGKFVVDRIMVFDPDGAHLRDWELYDHLPASIFQPVNTQGYWMSLFPDAFDLTHANSVEVAPDGSLLLSLRWLDTIVRLEGDPTAATFGQPIWWLSVDDRIPSDFAIQGEVFDGQHHATLDANDVLRLFDNREVGVDSRGLSYQLADGVATQVDRWDLARHCPIQGSVYPVGDDVVLTCASSRRIERFGVDEGATDLACDQNAARSMARAIPIDW